MKVAIVANAAATHTQRWARAMSNRGHDVKVFSVRHHTIEDVDVVPVLSPDTTNPSRVSISLGYIKLRLRLSKQLDQFAPDVVHAHYASTNGYIAALVGATPTILTVWGTDVIPKPGRALRASHRARIRRAVNHADIVTSTSEFMAGHVTDVAIPKRLEVLPFGVDLNRFTSRDLPRTATVLVVKSLENRYGVRHVIDAMALVRREIPNARLVVAGGGSLRDELEDLAVATSVPVTFLGYVAHDDIPGVIQDADIVVNPTIVDESFGVIVLEAQAMGRPVVGTDVGAVPTVCIEGETALLVEPGNAEDMADAIISVFQGESLTDAHEIGPKFVAATFDWSQSVDAMESLYRDLLQ